MKRAGDMRGLILPLSIPSIFAKLCLSEYDFIVEKEYMLYAGPASIKNRDHL